jgi:hypothetical protein
VLLTVESSLAVESTLDGVPNFLCSWFESSWYGYGKAVCKVLGWVPPWIRRKEFGGPQLQVHFDIGQGVRQSLKLPLVLNILARFYAGNNDIVLTGLKNAEWIQ